MKLINGDCLKELEKLEDNSIDLVVTDPPYEMVDSKNKFRNKRTYGKEINSMISGFNKNVLDELCRVMNKINIYIFCSHNQILDLMKYFIQEKNCTWEIITWHKTNPIPVCNNTYLHDTEYCFFFREKSTKLYGNYHTKHTYYISPINKKDKKKYNHPTIKPLSLINDFIINSSSENETVLDPFMGSGTTGEAAKSLNRKFIGIELDDTYFKTAKERIENT